MLHIQDKALFWGRTRIYTVELEAQSQPSYLEGLFDHNMIGGQRPNFGPIDRSSIEAIDQQGQATTKEHSFFK